MGNALHRCHALDDQGLYWLEEPFAYDNIASYSQLIGELKKPNQLGENFYGPRALFQAVSAGAGKYMMPDLVRIILAEPFKLEAGHLVVPDGSGSGVAWNEEAIKRHRLDA